MNANESNLFRFFFSLAWFFRQIIWCSIAFTPHLLSTNWQEADNNRLRRHDEQIWKERDRQAIYVQKRKPNKIVWHLLHIVVYTNSKKNLNHGHCIQDRYMSACEHTLGSQTAFNNNWENHACKWKNEIDI